MNADDFSLSHYLRDISRSERYHDNTYDIISEKDRVSNLIRSVKCTLPEVEMLMDNPDEEALCADFEIRNNVNPNEPIRKPYTPPVDTRDHSRRWRPVKSKPNDHVETQSTSTQPKETVKESTQPVNDMLESLRSIYQTWIHRSENEKPNTIAPNTDIVKISDEDTPIKFCRTKWNKISVDTLAAMWSIGDEYINIFRYDRNDRISISIYFRNKLYELCDILIPCEKVEDPDFSSHRITLHMHENVYNEMRVAFMKATKQLTPVPKDDDEEYKSVIKFVSDFIEDTVNEQTEKYGIKHSIYNDVYVDNGDHITTSKCIYRSCETCDQHSYCLMWHNDRYSRIHTVKLDI